MEGSTGKERCRVARVGEIYLGFRITLSLLV